ncbi:MAG: phospholipid carrier-dependent glycosyltransferase [Micrococcaceae bacterium]
MALELRAIQTMINANQKLIKYLIYAAIVLLGAILRFVRLGDPKDLVFDETYYVKDAYSYTLSGTERAWNSDANTDFISGNPDGIQDTGEYAVHPPVGKWLIAIGIKLFGQSSTFGWRFSAAVIGTISIFLLILVAEKLFSSTLLATTSGLLMAIDGVAITESRTSLLDIFLMFWALLAFYFLILDREKVRQEVNKEGLGIHWWRPYRLVAGITLGLAAGTKWSGLYFIAVWGLACAWWDFKLNKKNWVYAPISFLYLVGTGLVTYLISWTGWIRSSIGYDRYWAQSNPGQTVAWLPKWLQSLWAYQENAYSFHIHLHNSHPYAAQAWGWALQVRPTAFYYESYQRGQNGCNADQCATAVTSLGNPFIWWFASASLLVLIYFLFRHKDWRAGAILSGIVGGYLPWFLYPERTTYTFYSIAFFPFMALAATYVLGLVLGPSTASYLRRQDGFIVFTIILIIFTVASAFFYPIWTAEMISHTAWQHRMWFNSWI